MLQKSPPLLVVSDIDHIVIRTNYTNFSNLTYRITLDDLLNPESLGRLKLVFFDPEQLKPKDIRYKLRNSDRCQVAILRSQKL